MSRFQVIYLAGLVIGSAIRIVYSAGRRSAGPRQPEGVLTYVLMALWGVAQVLAVLFCATDWLSFADYWVPKPVQWVGTMLWAAALALLWRSHADLGRNWSPALRVKGSGQTLVVTGAYRYIRHPMYAAHVLWSLAQALMLPNGLAGPIALPVMAAFLIRRMGQEEGLLVAHFGDDYRRYMARTGRIVPRISLFGSSGRSLGCGGDDRTGVD